MIPVMKKPLAWLTAGSLFSAAVAVISFADPIPFPESGTYEFDFEADPLDLGWTLEGWVWDFIPPVGVEEMTGTGGGDGQIGASNPGGWDEFSFEEDEDVYPLAPLVPAGSYVALGFSGENWLVNAAAGDAVENEDGAFVVEMPGSALLEFSDLPVHTGISIKMKLGAGGSVDSGAQGSADGPFSIEVDGEEIFGHQFNSGGGNLTSQGVSALATGANLTNLYREQWNDNADAGPRSASDRTSHAWTLDSAYDITALPQLATIPHTSEELSIEFLHRMTSAAADEHVAIDDLVVTLITDVVADPNVWPGGDTYEEDFTEIGLEWKTRQWSGAPVMTGVTSMTGGGNSTGLVRPTDSGFDSAAFSGGEPVFPIDPLVEAQGYNEIDPRFAGSWLGSNASATHDGTATLFFKDLPPHDGIDLDFVLASTDSTDGVDVVPNAISNGNFQIVLDGEAIHEARYNGNSGASVDSEEFVEELASQANLSVNYRETWNDSDEGPIDADDRTSVGWTLDSAYDYAAFFDADGDRPIAHTADTLTLSFIHGMDGASDDEGIAIDSLKLQLLNVTEKVDFMIGSLSIGDANAVTLSWNSADGKTYGIDRTVDFSDWGEVADGVTSEGSETSFTDTTVPAGAKEAYYRVRLEGP
ncbi:MAG: hypothetical protein ACI9R3_000003 [Verrucomicrobiales bacterium]|jgi:hypothetical protein